MTEWEYEGEFFITEGLVNLWWNPKMSDKKNFGLDPPKLRAEVVEWMEDHSVTYYPLPIAGPPMWKFPTEEARSAFREQFLETDEGMRAIINEGVALKKAEEVRDWHIQGCPRDSGGRAYIEKRMTRHWGDDESKAELVRVFIQPDPETGEFKL